MKKGPQMNFILFLGRVFLTYGPVFLFLFFIGCASVSQTLTTTTEYMMDVPFIVNGKAFSGVGVAPLASSYKIEIHYPYGKISVLTLSTCHRDIPVQNDGTKAIYPFVPSDLELEENCELNIGVYNAKAQDGWAILQFERDDAKLIAQVECNGDKFFAKGVSLCQSKIGTTQRISFSVPVKVEIDPDCKLTTISPGVFEYDVQKGFCFFTFEDNDGNYHEHSIYGYETFIIRN
jgi:hypothetical protein